MLKGSTTEIPYTDPDEPIDYEIRDLVKYINSVDGIETVNSCCGHGEKPCQIWFKADSIEDVTKFIHRFLYRNYNWRIIVDISDTEIDNKQWKNPTYLLESTITDCRYTYLAIENLTYRMKEKCQAVHLNELVNKAINKCKM